MKSYYTLNFINEYAESLSKQKLTESLVSKYKNQIKGLSHVRIGNNCIGYMYFDNDNLVGYINIEKKDKETWIQALEVNKEYQGKGYGKYLLKECESNGAKYLSVNKKNEKAINLYKSNGWKVYEETDTMYFMKK